MDVRRDGNLIEAGIWVVLAVVLCVRARRSEKRLKPMLLFLAETMIAFGGSDLVESRTGAWWRPWWLFVWKAVCVLSLLLGFIRFHRLRKKSD